MKLENLNWLKIEIIRLWLFYWNSEEIRCLLKIFSILNPHFSRDAVIKCFKDKDWLDDKLESEFMEIDLKPHQKLNYKETFPLLNYKSSEKSFNKSHPTVILT